MNTIRYDILGVIYINKLIIHKDILSDNLEKIKANFPNKTLIYVAKANAYGLGIDVVLPTILKFTRFITVANFEEASEIKQKFPHTAVSTLLPLNESETIESVKLGNILSITNLQELQNTIAVCKNKSLIPKIQLKINSGMNRFGFDNKAELENALNLCFSNSVEIIGVFTHLSASDFEFSRRQIAKFVEIVGGHKVKSHITLNNFTAYSKAVGFDGIRSGIITIGGEENLLQTKQCFELCSEILELRKIEIGEYVGYNFGYQAKKAMTVAVVGIGYADISIRNLSNCGKVIVNGKKCDIIGYICMDVMFVDVTNCAAKKGDNVTIIGFDCDNDIKAVAKKLNTISYEVLTSISNRVKRVEK
ncbi:MAG: alanine racemase [Clostridia bacterium]